MNAPPHEWEPTGQRVGQIVRRRRMSLGLTLSALAQAVGTTKGYLSMIENHRLPNPPSQRLLESLERELGIDDGQLTRAADWARAPWPVRDQAQRGQQVMRLLEEAQQNGTSLDALFASGQLAKAVGQSPVPVPEAQSVVRYRVPLINQVTAGYPAGFTDLDYPARVADEYVIAMGVEDPDAFACRVCGESMMPQYRDEDIIVFSPSAKVSDGDDCFVRIEPDHETTFKRVFFDEVRQTIRLAPLNPKFESRMLDRASVAGLYRAVARYSKL